MEPPASSRATCVAPSWCAPGAATRHHTLLLPTLGAFLLRLLDKQRLPLPGFLTVAGFASLPLPQHTPLLPLLPCTSCCHGFLGDDMTLFSPHLLTFGACLPTLCPGGIHGGLRAAVDGRTPITAVAGCCLSSDTTSILLSPLPPGVPHTTVTLHTFSSTAPDILLHLVLPPFTTSLPGAVCRHLLIL